MNAPLPAVQRDAMNARERRIRRAAIARRILASAPGYAGSIEWEVLDHGPAWLSLPDADLVRLQRTVGAVFHASELRLWIDAASIAAVRSALGESVWRGMLRSPGSQATFGLSTLGGRLDPSPSDIGERLSLAGARVLLAALPPGPLQAAACKLFEPVEPAEILESLAASMVVTAQVLLDGKESA